jgi:hypothetical protein
VDKKPKRKRYNVDARTFVIAWHRSASLAEVSARLNMPESICSARASGYRLAGVHLPIMKRARSRHRLNVEELNELIAELKGETDSR